MCETEISAQSFISGLGSRSLFSFSNRQMQGKKILDICEAHGIIYVLLGGGNMPVKITKSSTLARKYAIFLRRHYTSKIAAATMMHLKTSKIGHQKKKNLKNLNCRMKMLRVEMEEISEEQKELREGQRQVREKFEAIESECEQLRKETILITRQSVNTQIRLALMFQILHARENHDFSKASQLTVVLRELIARENQQKET